MLMQLSGRAYHLAGVRAAVRLSECAGDGAERALERVCLYFGRPVYSAERVRLNTCAKHVAGVRAALSA